MNKKQGAIIVVLLALIICAGVMATKLNTDALYVGDQAIGQEDTVQVTQNESSTSVNYFAEQKLIRDNNETSTLQNLKALIDDENTSEETREETSEKYTEYTLAAHNESNIEMLLKSQGFEESLCFVEPNKVIVVVKSSEDLTEKQLKQIQQVVMEVTQIVDVEISSRE
ncbi:SpoIIIAH-like family protein [Clostridium sp. DL1XJH146]